MYWSLASDLWAITYQHLRYRWCQFTSEQLPLCVRQRVDDFGSCAKCHAVKLPLSAGYSLLTASTIGPFGAIDLVYVLPRQAPSLVVCLRQRSSSNLTRTSVVTELGRAAQRFANLIRARCTVRNPCHRSVLALANANLLRRWRQHLLWRRRGSPWPCRRTACTSAYSGTNMCHSTFTDSGPGRHASPMPLMALLSMTNVNTCWTLIASASLDMLQPATVSLEIIRHERHVLSRDLFTTTMRHASDPSRDGRCHGRCHGAPVSRCLQYSFSITSGGDVAPATSIDF